MRAQKRDWFSESTEKGLVQEAMGINKNLLEEMTFDLGFKDEEIKEI